MTPGGGVLQKNQANEVAISRKKLIRELIKRTDTVIFIHKNTNTTYLKML